MLTETNSFKASQGITKFKVIEKNSGDPEVQSEAALEQIKSYTEFLRAFFWLRVIRKRVLPIDCSMESIEMFLIDKEYFISNCNADGYGRGKMNQGQFCAMFVDFIIRLNNRHFLKKEKFLTTDKLHASFLTFCSGDHRFRGHNLQLLSQWAEQQKTKQQQQQQQRPNQSNRSSANRSTANKSPDVNQFCKFFNEGSTCHRDKLPDGKCQDLGGIIRSHLCWFQYPNNNFCGKDHPFIEHRNK